MELTTFKHSKKLKELGVKQDSQFNWYKDDKEFISYKLKDYTKLASAFTITELLELLPIYLKTEYTENNPEICRLNIVKSSKYTVGYLYTYKEDKKLINALAKLLIYIKS